MVSELPTGVLNGADWDGGAEPVGAWLDPADIDLLCTFAEVEPPFPLKIKPQGATGAEQRARYAAARARLAAQGLADARGPRGLAADLVRMLESGVGVVDALVARRGRSLGALVLAQRDDALLVTQDGAGGRVHVLSLRTHTVLDHLCALVPDHPAAMAAPFSLSRRALDSAHRAIQGAGRPLSADDLDRLLAEHGVDEQSARRLTTHLQPVLGNGQVGVAHPRGPGWERGGPELRWLDTARGRFRLGGRPGSEWMSVNPLSGDDLYLALRDLAGELWYR
ncbi:ESX secretion-associated protein EspG [Actinokineospora pegani]|uniref:ESX secretion-associated protein EspG n=1 Tax=Actinokineospora pegani TaxID=2654637 RepID=UPI0012E9EEFC|nr:ESX secretion-associated protein EspG [Actinokineospora pegani]